MRESPKSFGVSVGAVCCLISALQLWRGRPMWALGFGLTGSVLVGAALVAPAVLSAPSRVWWRLAAGLAWVNTRILLSLLYLLVFTPIAVVFRAIGRDHLGRRWRPGSSGWTASSGRRQKNHYEHMY